VATFLTTSKMDPALATRVEASVRGRRARRSSVVRRVVSIARFMLVVIFVFGVYVVLKGRERDRRELERGRIELEANVRAQAASLSPPDLQAVTRAEVWITRAAGAYAGDVVSDELRAPGALTAMLARPLVYLRGPLDAFTGVTSIPEAAASSSKDALLLCLIERPESREEKVLLDRVRTAYVGGWTMEGRTANVARLHDAVLGLPLLLPPWSERVRAAESAAEVQKLRRELERAPIERAKQAARAGLFLLAIDEPGDGKGPTELDGERPHPVRLELVDLAAARVLLRLRLAVDPGWISPARRATYASGLDGCALGFDVHQRVRTK
jgi:hypothetical protein